MTSPVQGGWAALFAPPATAESNAAVAPVSTDDGGSYSDVVRRWTHDVKPLDPDPSPVEDAAASAIVPPLAVPPAVWPVDFMAPECIASPPAASSTFDAPPAPLETPAGNASPTALPPVVAATPGVSGVPASFAPSTPIEPGAVDAEAGSKVPAPEPVASSAPAIAPAASSPSGDAAVASETAPNVAPLETASDLLRVANSNPPATAPVPPAAPRALRTALATTAPAGTFETDPVVADVATPVAAQPDGDREDRVADPVSGPRRSPREPRFGSLPVSTPHPSPGAPAAAHIPTPAGAARDGSEPGATPVPAATPIVLAPLAVEPGLAIAPPPQIELGAIRDRGGSTAPAPALAAARQRVVTEMAALVRIGGGEAEIELEPPELGRVRVRLSVRDHRVEASVVVENPAVRHLLESNLDGLVAALERHGLACERLDVRLGDSRGRDERRESEPPSKREPEDDTGPPAGHSAPAPPRRGRAGSGLVDYWL